MTLSGVVEKGPFAAGTTVSIYALTDAGNRDDLLAVLTTSDEFGSFSAEVDADQTVELEVVGRFLNEGDGTTANATLTLGAIVHAGSDSTAAGNVNVLTHIALPRHRLLLADPAITEADAQAQARAETLSLLESIMPPPPIASLHDVSLFSADSTSATSAYLVALSSVLGEHARALAEDNATEFVTELQLVLDALASDFGDGALGNQTLASRVREAARFIDPVAVRANLRNFAIAAGGREEPGDPLAFLDNDLDGISNYADQDDDGDGIDDVADAYPLDWACYLESQGDGTSCDVADSLLSSYQPSIIVEDDSGILYLLDQANNRIARWSMDQQAFGWSLEVSAGATAMAYSHAQDRLFIGHTTGEITAVDADGAHDAVSFATLPNAVQSLAAAGDFLLASYEDGRVKAETFSPSGVAIDRIVMSPRAGTLRWNEPLAQAVWLSSNNGLPQATGVDPATGLFDSSYYRASDSIRLRDSNNVFRVAADGSRLATAAGGIFQSTSLDWEAPLGRGFADLAWIRSETIAGLRPSAAGSRVEHLDLRGNTIEYAEFTGTPVRLFHRGDYIQVITQTDRLEFHRFMLGGDVDGDKVTNSLDAFPTDPAASADSDSDGYPDAWHNGFSAADSTTGLLIDAYPNDSICYLPGQGDGAGCDVAGNVPAFTPDEIVADRHGMVYLLDRAEQRIYRWDPSSGYRNPLIAAAGSDPLLLRYSPENDRLYLGYASGKITYWDLTDPASERHFAALPVALLGLQPVGRYVWTAQRKIGAAGGFNLTFDAEGRIADETDQSAQISRTSAWNPALERLYVFRDGVPSLAVHYVKVGQSNGSIGFFVPSPHYGDYAIVPPMRVSLDGRFVLLGSGDIYEASHLDHVGSIPGGFVDGQWTEQSGTVVIRDAGGNTRLEHRDLDGTLVETATFAGTPLAVQRAGTGYTVVTGLNSPTYYTYIPAIDADGDGVNNAMDAFPVDPAASIDSDGDGYPNMWTLGMTEADSTSGLTLDPYPHDSACYLPEHGDGTTCDITSTIPDYEPMAVALDSNGILYLFSPENNRVYRRDVSTGEHLNPFALSSVPWPGTATPIDMVHHRVHNRLYLSYDNNEINYIDLASDGEEMSLTRPPGRMGGMADAGNFLLVQDDSGFVYTHHTYDSDGELRASFGVEHYSHVYAWNDTLNRVYYFKGRRYPNDLYYQQIDQLTGEIVAEGEAPYRGSYALVPPIRSSADGSRVVLGSGAVYNASDLMWIGNYSGSGNGFTDGIWLTDGRLMTIRPDGADTVLEVFNAAFSLDASSVIPNAPIAIRRHGDNVIVVTAGASPTITLVTP